MRENKESGLPSDITLAQKYGERTTFLKDGVTVDAHELHDCGIVYYPQHPYLLCVMTKGKDFDAQARMIQNASRVVYQEMEKIFHSQ